ncbi:MAG: tyrosine--tRNA ligase [Candidatus Taylorbacteria bacterium RIFCSPHIGHO2_01_FULL_45_63]|uniref:Tyrosine--tRNA ligase n=1 Tax=Candidatus Taylorbacteria bacterium RIFCSPHIGHO2_02_FULL_45_35 TaxID=1802311 RepID=A0A1G2MV51_9BACT|nr:MAG: tyrosine--tRNA ligase [Candidatus Taylorbacteria bacterium RIFCSPHIGHO2_01_FULL_45_63]OHA27149.1 MAG: tyrosine--tRNA ligase [Candidatus Taylorbacteria bacterium RIFCSPHIGHO2_02_FULL_45_35]OHA33849.1 MAG: tyrosine--tRNA ligase [Candidatus Taylorbacteria bacterium RIFCSPLOWO2_01_FULL_45_34b]
MFWGQKRKIVTDEVKITELLSRGVEDVFVKENLLKKLRFGKSLRVKLGIDPTGPAIHLGRAIILRKLRDFQRLGHHIILIIGDFTALIGDPSDKLEKRPMLTSAVITKNLATYKKQIAKIIDIDKTEFRFNSAWLSKLHFAEVAELAESFSVPQMSSRRNFKDRLERGGEVSLREFLYPLMQGYDSVAVKADVELGGFDQLFNLKAGRIIQKHYGQKEQDILTLQMLEGTDGRKMSTSWGNVITIIDTPNDMFGKIMSLKDELIPKYFLLCTDVSTEELTQIKKRLISGENPRDIKMELGVAVASLYHGTSKAVEARRHFTETFTKGAVPEDAEEITVQSGTLLVDALLSVNIISSKSDFRRLVEDGAVHVLPEGGNITDPQFIVSQPLLLKVGKRRFVKIKIS